MTSQHSSVTRHAAAIPIRHRHSPRTPNERLGQPVAARSPDDVAWYHAPVAVWLFVLGLAANMFSGNSAELGLPIGLDRIFLPAAVLLAFLDRRDAWWRLRSVHIVMTLAAVIATTSFVGTGFAGGMASVFSLLDRVYVPFLLFTFAPYLLGTAARRDLFLRTLTIMGAYLAVTTILEGLGHYELLVPGYIGAHHLGALQDGADEVIRAGGPFLSGEANGMALAMCGFAAVLLAYRSRGPWRVLATATTPVALIACVATMTRSVWLGTAVGIVAVALTRWKWAKWLPVGAVVAALALGSGAVAFPEFAADVRERASTSRSLWDRVTTNDAAVRIIADRPLTGLGWQQFVHTGDEYVRQADTVPLSNTDIEVHNVLLGRGAELGIPGLLAFGFTVLLGPVAALLPRLRADLVPWQLLLLATFSVWAVVSMTSPNPYPLPTFLMWTIAGFVSSAPRRDSGVPPASFA